MIPTLDGNPVWQGACLVQTEPAARAVQLGATFARNGLGLLDAGGRGYVTRISGTLSGQGSAGLAAAEAAVRSYQDGGTHTLVDSLGTTWATVLLTGFRPLGRIGQSPSGLVYRQFVCELRHLS